MMQTFFFFLYIATTSNWTQELNIKRKSDKWLAMWTDENYPYSLANWIKLPALNNGRKIPVHPPSPRIPHDIHLIEKAWSLFLFKNTSFTCPQIFVAYPTCSFFEFKLWNLRMSEFPFEKISLKYKIALTWKINWCVYYWQ